MSSNDILMIIINRISRKSQQTVILIDLRYIPDHQTNSKIWLDAILELYYGNN